eukprot:01916.XXX_838_999_1 [CDS] Oithona nana genome sequencing.
MLDAMKKGESTLPITQGPMMEVKKPCKNLSLSTSLFWGSLFLRIILRAPKQIM